jgi:hypothetical protein
MVRKKLSIRMNQGIQDFHKIKKAMQRRSIERVLICRGGRVRLHEGGDAVKKHHGVGEHKQTIEVEEL